MSTPILTLLDALPADTALIAYRLWKNVKTEVGSDTEPIQLELIQKGKYTPKGYYVCKALGRHSVGTLLVSDVIYPKCNMVEFDTTLINFKPRSEESLSKPFHSNVTLTVNVLGQPKAMVIVLKVGREYPIQTVKTLVQDAIASDDGIDKIDLYSRKTGSFWTREFDTVGNYLAGHIEADYVLDATVIESVWLNPPPNVIRLDLLSPQRLNFVPMRHVTRLISIVAYSGKMLYFLCPRLIDDEVLEKAELLESANGYLAELWKLGPMFFDGEWDMVQVFSDDTRRRYLCFRYERKILNRPL